MVYDGLATKPRKNTRKLADEVWVDGYVKAIGILKELFEETETLQQAKDISVRMLGKPGLTKASLRQKTIQEVNVFWAAGRGSRTLCCPGTLTFRQQVMAEWICHMGWPESKAALDSALFPVEFKDNQCGIARVDGDRYAWDKDRYKTSKEAIAEIIIRANKEQHGNNPSRRGCRWSVLGQNAVKRKTRHRKT
jgi:hypothetical protein